MDDAESVVETVQTEAAVTGAEVVARVAAVGDSIIAAEVTEVAEVLADHVEQSEERHEEILDGETWLKSQTELLLTTLQSIQALLISQLALVVAKVDLLQTTVNSQNSTPQAPVQPVVEVAEVLVVEPENDADGLPVAPTKPQSEPVKRKRRII